MKNYREIPYNYTSADDRKIITRILGVEAWDRIERLRNRRVTGRSSRLLMRFVGDVFIHIRNPFLYRELLDNKSRRKWFINNLKSDIEIIKNYANSDHDVLLLIEQCRKILSDFQDELDALPSIQRSVRNRIGAILGKENVKFDPFSLVCHATDATDWRLFLPIAVVYPTGESQVAPLIRAISELKLYAIPRGAGTGLTGGSVPLAKHCVIVNTERLDKIKGIHEQELNGRKKSAFVAEVEAGVITQDIMSAASAKGLVFATDPTSSWASTVGGNISENSGGKSAVLWGTAIDNILAYSIVMPSGKKMTVTRTNHQMRKILPGDNLIFEISDESDTPVKTISLASSEIRKKDIWKDITNKTLKGLPGIQKEGTDGIITSAKFVLYPAYKRKQSLCLEFFGDDMVEASRVIQEITEAFPIGEEEVLSALEHFDDQYVKAIQYRVKAPINESPLAVLLIDIVAHTDAQLKRGVKKIESLIKSHQQTHLFVAIDEQEAELFWSDRKKLGAIASRTNAFKLNEDIVLPVHALADFADFIGELNVSEQRYTQGKLIVALKEFFAHAHSPVDSHRFDEKIPGIEAMCDKAEKELQISGPKEISGGYLTDILLKDFHHMLQGYDDILEDMDRVIETIMSRVIIAATHMHAGDGNVHVNIPVFSNDRDMFERAELVVDKIMAKVKELDGVVSGEHGIGITKLKYLEKHLLDDLVKYRGEIDPLGIMNPGKLSDLSLLDSIFTPSFNILELEAGILKHASLEALALKIEKCVRCGRCKSDCCVFYPKQNLFFHPRNKNLAIGSIIEALLYDAQRALSTGFEILRYLEEIGDHCTICHKCLRPCPVNIDTGEVSILEREILASKKFKHTSGVTKLVLSYLNSVSPGFNTFFRKVVITGGTRLQQLASRLVTPYQKIKYLSRLYPMMVLRSVPLLPSPITLRDALPICSGNQVIIFEAEGKPLKTVFYFPGCGSERLFSEISMASVYLLIKAGVNVVLPPPFLCCGFPFHANARTETFQKTKLRNTIIVSQIKDMFTYLEFDATVVSCGTCREALEKTEINKILGVRLCDVTEYANSEGFRVNGERGTYLYHAPCHDSLDGKAEQVLKNIGTGLDITKVPYCCSEAGTLALSRPDISGSMLTRKGNAISNKTRGGSNTVMLTNCPSCIQGLGRNRERGIIPRHISLELASQHNRDWRGEFDTMSRKCRVISY